LRLRSEALKNSNNINFWTLKQNPVRLIPFIDGIDTLLIVPDHEVINRYSAKPIIRALYDKKIAVLGYSKRSVESGTIASLYSTPDQIFQQALLIIKLIERGEVVQGLYYPKEYQVALNHHLSNSLDLIIEQQKISSFMTHLRSGDQE